MNHLGLVLVLFLLSVQVWSQPTILPHIKNADLEQAVTERFNTSFFNLPSHAEKIILNNIFSQGHVLTTFYSNESVEEELGWRQNSMEDIQDKKIDRHQTSNIFCRKPGAFKDVKIRFTQPCPRFYFGQFIIRNLLL